MKVFVHYKPHNAADAFEGTRLRKTIKGACEVVDVSWVDSPQEDVDVAHFLSPDDFALLKRQKDAGVATVVSAFYAENDPNASFLTSDKVPHLTPKAKLLLREADLVLVPDERMIALCEKEGVHAKMEVLLPAVRLNRFSRVASESKIFRRYFGVTEDQKVVVAKGSYDDKNAIITIKKIAEACPNLEFYFFGAPGKFDPLNLHKRIARLRRTPNLHLKDIVQDDVYRSALMNSLAYISNDSVRPDPVGTVEAFASQTQVVAFDSDRHNPLLVENESCYFFTSVEKMAKYLNSLSQGSAESTIDTAYAIAKAHNLIVYGKELKRHYEALASGESR